MEDDKELMERIERLAHEEHELFDRESRGEASTKERARLKEIEGELETSYDLLRARRARRSAGLDPDVEPVTEPEASRGSRGTHPVVPHGSIQGRTGGGRRAVRCRRLFEPAWIRLLPRRRRTPLA
jgi:hypothetical protein